MDLLNSLETRGFMFNDTLISFFNEQENMFESMGKFPLDADFKLSLENVKDNRLKIKY